MSLDIQLTDKTFEKDVLQSPAPVLVDFWAPWCGPCRMLGPIIEELAKEYAGKIRVAKINTDENAEVAGRFRITALPSLLFFNKGKVMDQMVGVHPKAEIKKKLESLISS
ncbi:MAG: thioredoxin [Elusimicrobia bacterium]|nr:thioredoxin [Elusimicrobiota bacterium]